MKVSITGLIEALSGRHATPRKASAREAADTMSGPLGIELVWCPPGTFTMGSPKDEVGRKENETRHEVTLTRGFWIGKYPVTQRQWKKVMGTDPSRFRGGQLPVEPVSWDEAQEFIAKIGKGYRLPTEAEWEYACRAAATTAWGFGNDQDRFRLGDYAWYKENSDNRKHPVGQKQPNNWGIHDMLGNVWEWCQDRYQKDLGCAPVTDPKGPASGDHRVLRGGCWDFSASYCRPAARLWYSKGYRDHFVGFRLALDDTPQS